MTTSMLVYTIELSYTHMLHNYIIVLCAFVLFLVSVFEEDEYIASLKCTTSITRACPEDSHDDEKNVLLCL